MTHFTKENIDRIWNALEYTRGTIPAFPKVSNENEDWILIHRGRAHQSRSFLDRAIKLVNQMKTELQEESK